MVDFRPGGIDFMAYTHDHPRPTVSVIIPVYNKLDLTRVCIESLHTHPVEPGFEIIVVDNGSTDGTTEWLREQQEAKRLRSVLSGENLGFADGCNAGAAVARGKYLLFLNNDMEVKPSWLDPLVTTLDHDPQVGVVGAKLLFPDGTIQHGGVALVEVHADRVTFGGIHLSYQKSGSDPAANRAQQMQVVTGACLAIRPEVFAAAGGFDAEYWNGNEDVDLCLKVKQAGWKVVYRPECEIIHYESQSGTQRWTKVEHNLQIFMKRWHGVAGPDFIRDQDGKFIATPDNKISPYIQPRLRLGEPEPSRWRASVVVLVWNALDYVRRCADSLLQHTGDDCELIFVDNGSEMDTLKYLSELDGKHERVRVIFNGENRGFAAGNNVGIAASRGRYICLLNSDTVVTAGWLDRLIAAAESGAGVGLAGPVTNSITGGQKLDQVGYDQDSLEGLDDFAATHASTCAGGAEQALWLVGYCLLIKREVVEKIGGLDEGFGRGNYEDTDYCLRAFLAGYSSVVARDSFVHHYGSRSFIAGGVDYDRELDEKFQIFRKKWDLEPTARQTGNLNLKQLIDDGFLPGLHFHPLPLSTRVEVLPLPSWEADRWTEKAERFYALGRLDKAERMLRAVLAGRPDHDRAANDLAVIVWQADSAGKGRDEAVDILAGILARDPNNTDARWNLEQMEEPVGV
ncbi:hypothetical protein CO151_14545 [bacterium CG_4_9_14_3_um_filter_65_15]|nr:MAG: hypothetical protein CO151_14545 [bacterium CG_4_9_14_3_um_filter_65_15]